MLPKVILMTSPGDLIGGELFHASSVVPPLGLGYLSAVVDKSKFDVKVIDPYMECVSLKNTRKLLAEEDPDIIGVTFSTEKRFDAFNLIRDIRRSLPEVTIITGGPHSSLAPEDTLKGIPEIDFIVRGEGEVTLPELLSSLGGGRIKDLDGISYRSKGAVMHNRDRDFIRDLDTIPFPDYVRLDFDKYNFMLNIPGKGKCRAATLITSRGCPFGCSFCATSRLWGKRCRARSVNNIIREMEFLMKRYGIDSFWILDDTFTVDRKRVEELCNEILSRSWKISWYASIRVDNMDKDILALMKEAGLVFVTFAIESGSERIVNDVIGKGITIEKGKAVDRWCKELDIKRRIFFMVSFPDETPREFDLSLSLIKELSGDTTLSVLRIYPGTAIERIAKERGILPEDFSWIADDNKLTFFRFLLGNSPVFLDRFGWFRIFRYLFKWADSGQGYLKPFALIPALLKEIRSPNDIYKVFLLGLAFISCKAEKFIEFLAGRGRK